MIIINPEEFVKKVEGWIEDKSGIDIQSINITELSSIANYFVIASGSSDRQVKAIADNIEHEAKLLEIFPKGIEGQREGRWILLDFYDVIIHIFHEEERGLYNLEELWKDGIVSR
ncbi:ribosome silencing factor [Acetobacterium bakii]|uniref:Ribosomal silencing factor RsfS n=1 Tax=Acetobacterium bakii TaxID=52689 RepID=A0A0L6TXI5_9FIRM|nr:ribosome silencing factor [Acetobacterium bakii]KNZ40971.1 iojap family protein [Acetobacterium bakii]